MFVSVVEDKTAWIKLVVVVLALKKHTAYSSLVCKVSKNVSVSVQNVSVSVSASDPKLKVSASSRSQENFGRSRFRSWSCLGLKIKSLGLVSVSEEGKVSVTSLLYITCMFVSVCLSLAAIFVGLLVCSGTLSYFIFLLLHGCLTVGLLIGEWTDWFFQH